MMEGVSMAMQFNLLGSQVFSLVPGESFNLLSLNTRHIYRIQNQGPATVILDWDAPPDPTPLSLEAGRSIDVDVNRLNVRIPQSPPPSAPYAIGWYQFLG
jgi:hypothetical protein